MIAYLKNFKDRHPFVPQFIRFFCVGLINTAIDFTVLNSLIYLTGKSSGIYFPIFKSTSFIVSVTNSYLMNKRWTFKSLEAEKAKQFAKFIGINLIGWGINVGSASYVVNVIGAPDGFSPVLWANIGAVSATAITLFWNFTGMKFIVFKK
jgi:putative flippase GtrA